MYDLLLKFRRSVRRMLRPIQLRAVTLCKSDNLNCSNVESSPFVFAFLAAL